MSLFDSIIGTAADKFGLSSEKSGGLLAALLGLITTGGFDGFLDRFRTAGLGDTVDSWITTGDNTPLTNEQLESALGEGEIDSLADQAGVDRATATSAMATMIPSVVDTLTPDGEVPDKESLLSRIGGFLSGWGGALSGAALGGLGASGAYASDAASKTSDVAGTTYDQSKEVLSDRIGVTGGAAGTVSDRVSGAMGNISSDYDGDGDGGSSPLKWLLPLIILGLLIALGFWFCSKAPVSPTPSAGNANANKTSINATNTNSTAKAVDSSFKLEAKDGKYIASGVVPDQATLDKIKTALTAQFGEGNVDFAGLKVDASAKPFAAGWWDNFGKLLPALKDWKNGSLAFAGTVITGSGIPAAVVEQIKSLFPSWTFSDSGGGETANANRTLTEVSLPNGTKLQAYPGGIEDQLIKFIQSDEYKNGTADTFKERWFSFDDLNFNFNSTELAPESKRQLDNIVAILKAFPDVKIKLGGYTDKKGNDDANKKLSDDRAKAVKSTLEKAGVGAQVPEAEGYGEEFAKVPETGSDEERKADRKTSVRLLK